MWNETRTHTQPASLFKSNCTFLHTQTHAGGVRWEIGKLPLHRIPNSSQRKPQTQTLLARKWQRRSEFIIHFTRSASIPIPIRVRWLFFAFGSLHRCCQLVFHARRASVFAPSSTICGNILPHFIFITFACLNCTVVCVCLYCCRQIGEF